MFGFLLDYPHKEPFYYWYIRQPGQELLYMEAHTHTTLLSNSANVLFLLSASWLTAIILTQWTILFIILHNEQVLCLTRWSTKNYSVWKGLTWNLKTPFPIYKAKIIQVSRNNNIPCILFTYLNLFGSAKFHLKSQGNKMCNFFIHSKNFRIENTFFDGQKKPSPTNL